MDKHDFRRLMEQTNWSDVLSHPDKTRRLADEMLQYACQQLGKDEMEFTNRLVNGEAACDITLLEDAVMGAHLDTPMPDLYIEHLLTIKLILDHRDLGHMGISETVQPMVDRQLRVAAGGLSQSLATMMEIDQPKPDGDYRQAAKKLASDFMYQSENLLRLEMGMQPAQYVVAF